jgi:hypothetical protein
MNNPIDTANELIKELRCYQNHDDLIETLREIKVYAEGRLDSWKEELEFLESLKVRGKSTTFAVDDIVYKIENRIGDLKTAIKILENGLK